MGGKALTRRSLSSDERAAPVAGVNIRNRLRESPAMPGEIERSVLPFAVRVICWWIQDARPQCFGAGVVRVHIFHAHHQRLGRWLAIRLAGDHHRPCNKGNLGAMFSDAQALHKTETPAQPLSRLDDIRIRDLRDDHAERHRAVV